MGKTEENLKRKRERKRAIKRHPYKKIFIWAIKKSEEKQGVQTNVLLKIIIFS
jgi:hypothetical protein